MRVQATSSTGSEKQILICVWANLPLFWNGMKFGFQVGRMFRTLVNKSYVHESGSDIFSSKPLRCVPVHISKLFALLTKRQEILNM